MEISCDIIRDLLPLYAENLTSMDSNALVDAHLCSCDACTKQLGILKKAAQLPVEVDTGALKRVGDIIRRKRILTVVTALMVVLTLIVTGFTFMLTPIYLSAEKAIEGIELREDGGLAIDYASGITGRAGYALDAEFTQWGIMCQTTRYDWLNAKWKEREWNKLSPEEQETYILEKYGAEEMTQRIWDRFHNISVEYGTWTLLDGSFLHVYDPDVWIEGNGQWTEKQSDKNHWYLDVETGGVETLLWGTETQKLDAWNQPFYGYAVLLFGMIGLSVCLNLLSRKIKGWKQELCIRFSILCGSVALSTLLVTGGNLVIGERFTQEWFSLIGMHSVIVTLMLLFWRQLYLLNKQDKGL